MRLMQKNDVSVNITYSTNNERIYASAKRTLLTSYESDIDEQ